jgi:hypothetical protein
MSQATRLKALSAELEAARELAELLERQRDALIAQDTERLDEVTAGLQERADQFRYLVQTREQAFREAGELGSEDIAFLRELHSVEAQLQSLAQLNQQIIADRLAYVRVLLSRLCPDEGQVGYAVTRKSATGKGGPGASGMARSA